MLTAAMMDDLSGYRPYEGRQVVGWPETVLSRGRVIVDDGTLLAKPGKRPLSPPAKAGAATEPTGRIGAELDPGQNFSAALVAGRG
jgi:dihydropyrimidinase